MSALAPGAPKTHTRTPHRPRNTRTHTASRPASGKGSTMATGDEQLGSLRFLNTNAVQTKAATGAVGGTGRYDLYSKGAGARSSKGFNSTTKRFTPKDPGPNVGPASYHPAAKVDTSHLSTSVKGTGAFVKGVRLPAAAPLLALGRRRCFARAPQRRGRVGRVSNAAALPSVVPRQGGTAPMNSYPLCALCEAAHRAHPHLFLFGCCCCRCCCVRVCVCVACAARSGRASKGRRLPTSGPGRTTSPNPFISRRTTATATQPPTTPSRSASA